MEIKLKDGVIFNSFDNEQTLKIKILDFIKNSKTDKILYKGNPLEINYKLLKKVLPINGEKQIENLEIDKSNLREGFEKFINKINSQYCLIYKK